MSNCRTLSERLPGVRATIVPMSDEQILAAMRQYNDELAQAGVLLAAEMGGLGVLLIERLDVLQLIEDLLDEREEEAVGPLRAHRSPDPCGTWGNPSPRATPEPTPAPGSAAARRLGEPDPALGSK